MVFLIMERKCENERAPRSTTVWINGATTKDASVVQVNNYRALIIWIENQCQGPAWVIGARHGCEASRRRVWAREQRSEGDVGRAGGVGQGARMQVLHHALRRGLQALEIPVADHEAA